MKTRNHAYLNSLARVLIVASALSLLFLPALAPVGARRQQRQGLGTGGAIPARSKAAVVDTSAFHDEGRGVASLVSAVRRVDAEFQPRRVELQDIEARRQRLAEEIARLKNVADSAALREKMSQAELLKKEVERKSEGARAARAARSREVIAPLAGELVARMRAAAARSGVTHLIDAARTPVVYAAAGTDITREFIAAQNTDSPPNVFASVPEGRLAVVNTGAFLDEGFGVTRLLDATRLVDAEFQPLQSEVRNVKARYDRLVSEIEQARHVLDAGALRQKIEAAESLKQEFERETQDAQAAYEKRLKAALAPVQEEVRAALREFAAARAITVLIDVSRTSDDPASAGDVAATDITAEFVADYNRRHSSSSSSAAAHSKP